MLSNLERFLVEQCGMVSVPQGSGETIAISYIKALHDGEVKKAVQAAHEEAMARGIEMQVREKALDKALAAARWWTSPRRVVANAGEYMAFLRGGGG